MPAVNKKTGSLLYHLTALDNLPSVIENGLLSRYDLNETMSDFYDVADSSIIMERREYDLDKYIPFHFHPRTPFDYAVKNKNRDVNYIYLCLSRSYARNNNFLILPKHPLSLHDLRLYDYDDGFSMIDWDAMEESVSSSKQSHVVHMAECLSPNTVLISKFIQIGVKDDETKNQVQNMLKTAAYPHPHVNIQKTWF